ncbi:hypothetical protein K439DRAFT_1077011 [Ramaria rubella]|nr:hypothetical protein K439DRAFT_1077011 [Ramaria rubella]
MTPDVIISSPTLSIKQPRPPRGRIEAFLTTVPYRISSDRIDATVVEIFDLIHVHRLNRAGILTKLLQKTCTTALSRSGDTVTWPTFLFIVIANFRIPPTSQAFLQERFYFFVQNLIFVSTLAIFAYDFLLSFSREIELVWLKTFRFTTILYFMTRYLPIGFLLVQVAVDSYELQRVRVLLFVRRFESLLPAYKVLVLTTVILTILGRAAITTVMTMQLYALYYRSLVVLIILGSLGSATTVLDGVEAASINFQATVPKNVM